MSEHQRQETLKRLRAIRSGNRGVVTKYSIESVELIGVGEDAAKGQLSTISSSLKEKTDRLKQLDVQILELCGVDDIAPEIQESEQILYAFYSRQSEDETSCYF